MLDILIFIIIVALSLGIFVFLLFCHYQYCKYKSPFLKNGNFLSYLQSFYKTIIKGE